MKFKGFFEEHKIRELKDWKVWSFKVYMETEVHPWAQLSKVQAILQASIREMLK